MALRFREVGGDIGTNSEINDPEAFVDSFGTVTEQLSLVSGGIRADTDLLDAFGKLLQ